MVLWNYSFKRSISACFDRVSEVNQRTIGLREQLFPINLFSLLSAHD